MSLGIEMGLRPDLPAVLVLIGAGAVASGMNAIAGGGSLVSFPVLVGLGVPALPANATNSTALWPGGLAGAVGYLERLSRTGRHLRTLLVPTFLGSVLGAWLLVNTPERAFQLVVPILVCTATLLLAFQPNLRRWSQSRKRHVPVLVGAGIQFLVSTYGGYFGAGMGILMLAAFGLYIEGDIHDLNAVKNWLSLVINLVASVMFLLQGLVYPWPALALMVGAVLGGYLTARLSLRVAPDRIRRGAVMLGVAMTVWFTWKAMAS